MKKRTLLVLTLCFVSFFVFSLLFTLPHIFYFNVSLSAPQGIFFLSSDRPTDGDYCIVPRCGIPVIVFGLPETLLKRLAYSHSEYIEINDQGVFANGVFVCERPSKSLVPKYFFARRLDADKGLLINDNIDSFDSRHFGPVKLSFLKKVVPILIFKERIKS